MAMRRRSLDQMQAATEFGRRGTQFGCAGRRGGQACQVAALAHDAPI